MTDTQVAGLVCTLIGIIGPLYIAMRKPERMRSPWFIVFPVADAAWMIFLGLQFFAHKESF